MTAAQSDPELSRSTEDYLKVIYELVSRGAGTAQTSAIAEALNVAPPSVSGMLRRLADSGLLDHERYRGVQLTESGRRAALRIVRRHRILEAYLTEKLGYDWDSVHEEAERLEHAVSDELIERMASALGHPRYDPHGAPIPTSDGDIEEPVLIPLADVEVGAMAEVRMVGDRDGERLRYIASLGLKPGVVVTVKSRQPFEGPVIVRVQESGTERTIGHSLAKALRCAVLKRKKTQPKGGKA